jgi:hypothetical protein
VCILNNGNSNTESLAYTSLVGLILEYGAARWDPHREGQISVLDRVKNKAAKSAHHRNYSNDLAQRRKIAHIYADFKVNTREWDWKDTANNRVRQANFLFYMNIFI